MADIDLMDKESQPQTVYLANYKPPAFYIDEVQLDVNLGDEQTFVKSVMRIRRNRHDGGSHELKLHGEELILEDIKLDGQPLVQDRYKITKDHLLIPDAPDQFELEITVKIYPQKNTALSGLYRSRDTFCTQCEAEGFRRITFYQDQPDILAKFTTTIHADKKKYPVLLSNGNLVASGEEANGRHWVRWEDPFKKPSYLFALVAGDFDILEGNYITQSNRNVDLKIYVEKGLGDQSAHALYSLQEAMRWDEITYGREYDLDVYMIVAIGDFNMGAMENKGLNIFNTRYVLAKPETATDMDYIHILSVVGHEYFHNWTGNRVTCRDWFQLSLKEGLTIFRDQSFTEDTLSQGVMRIQDVNMLRETQFPEDSGPLAHPVRPESYIEINNFYTATVYNKGAEVLRMLQTILGRQMFRKGMDLYFATYDGQAVTIEDYIKIMEDVSGLDLEQFRLWYSQAGTPVVTVEDEYDAARQTYTLTINQQTPPTPGQKDKLAQHIPIRIGLLDAEGKEIPLQMEGQLIEPEKVLHLTTASQQFQFHHVKCKPVPSLLRGFSAPVKLNYHYSSEQLLFLFEHDRDEVNRWEAGQLYAMHNIRLLIEDYHHERKLQLPPEWAQTVKNILKQNMSDKYLLAEMLRLPSENYIGEQMQVVDVDAIHAVREFVINQLAVALQDEFKEIYAAYAAPTGSFRFDIKDVGQRALKNGALGYLARLPQGDELAMQQFNQSYQTNMTDAVASLSCLANCDSQLRQRALDTFYDYWKHDALVVDKWLAVQAASTLPDTLSRIRKLANDKAFDIRNPNKVYALIGAFGMRNPVCFHQKDGEGYVFLREMVQKLDELNPQVAARMIKPLTMWRRYDAARQKLMRDQLDIILRSATVTPDVYELASKSLKEG